jgi:TLC domain
VLAGLETPESRREGRDYFFSSSTIDEKNFSTFILVDEQRSGALFVLKRSEKMWWHWVYSEEEVSLVYDVVPGLWESDARDPERFNLRWKSERRSLAELAMAVVLVATFYTLFRSLLVRFVFKPFADRYVVGAGYEEHVGKFCESAVRFAFYLPSSCVLLYFSATLPWFWKPWEYWDLREMPEREVELCYVAQLAWYAHLVFAHVVLDERKGDFWIMVGHHLATIGLLLSSYWAGFYRVGIIVLFCHDPCDPFLEAGKMFNYLHWFWSGVVSFTGLVLSWIVLRLIIYPLTPLYSVGFELRLRLGDDAPYLGLFIILLSFLQVLHIYWFALICRVGVVLWRNSESLLSSAGISLDAREDDATEALQKKSGQQQKGGNDDKKEKKEDNKSKKQHVKKAQKVD